MSAPWVLFLNTSPVERLRIAGKPPSEATNPCAASWRASRLCLSVLLRHNRKSHWPGASIWTSASPPLTPAGTTNLPSVAADELPAIITRAGPNAVFAAQEFFFGKIRNEHTRRAYQHAVKQFLAWIGKHGGGAELGQIAPWQVGKYFEEMKDTTGIATRNQHLSALRHFFDGMVTRHAIVLNPALSVRGERYAAIEGKTPEISIDQARQLLASLDTSQVIGLRDRAILAILVYTTSRAGAVARLRCGDFYEWRAAVDAAFQ